MLRVYIHCVMLLVVTFLLLVLNNGVVRGASQLCNGGGAGAQLWNQTINFDDLATFSPSQCLDGPYILINWSAENTAFSNQSTMVCAMNTNTTFYTQEWQNIAASPNTILATYTGNLLFSMVNETAFGLYDLKLRAVTVNGTQMVVNTTRNGILKSSTQVTLYLGSWTTVSVQKSNLDHVKVGCVDPDVSHGTCGSVAYDDVNLCFFYYL